MAKNRHLKSSTPRKDQMDAYVNRVANEEYKAIVKKGKGLKRPYQIIFNFKFQFFLYFSWQYVQNVKNEIVVVNTKPMSQIQKKKLSQRNFGVRIEF